MQTRFSFAAIVTVAAFTTFTLSGCDGAVSLEAFDYYLQKNLGIHKRPVPLGRPGPSGDWL
ncbi:hypothetical protein FACS189468_3430 [Spirochaetia bacterium]|nr:hypothetical protein FACS189468_3430 [Spirochaetia bacterium]